MQSSNFKTAPPTRTLLTIVILADINCSLSLFGIFASDSKKEKMKGRRVSSGNKRKALGNNNNNRKQQDSSFLAKLQMLRAFVTTGFDESDLSSCLRQCGCNVELAAERLMTGQYKPSPKCTPSGFFSMSPCSTTTPETPSPSTTTTQNRVPPSSSSSSSSTAKRPRVESAHNSTTMPPIVTPKPTKSSSHHSPAVVGNGAHLLLCQRWLVGISATRARQFSYKEPLQLTSTNSGPPMVRFRGAYVEGTLPLHVSTMLAPLLRCQEQQSLISLSAEALMDERNVQIGADVPLSLSVFVEDPHAFFELFETAEAVNTKEQAWLAHRIASQSKKKLRLRPLAEAAFGLLQWAQYGDVPQFNAPQEQQQGENKDQPQEVLGADGSSSKDGNGDEEDEDEEPIVLREDEFETEGSRKESTTSDPPEWADSVVDESTSLLPEAEDPEGLAVTLRPYQKQALHWMIQRETTSMESESNRDSLEKELKLLAELNKNGSTNNALPTSSSSTTVARNGQDITCECGPVIVSDKAAKRSETLSGMVDPVNHPLWQRRFLSKPGMKDTISFYVNELVGVASGETPNPPRQCVGGLLADAMGLGKTVMLVALILKDKQDSLANNAGGRHRSFHGSTLVVAPLSLITQWEEEIATKTTLSVRVYYGDTARSLDIGNTDVVITTYGTVQQAYMSSVKQASARSNSLLAHNWRRIILDEAHGIKNPLTAVSKACCALQAEKRWCITGTPIQNSLQDVHGLLKFLKHEPWCEGAFWKAAITSAITQEAADDTSSAGNSSSSSSPRSSNAGLSIAIDRVRRLLAPLILRRTKDTLTKDGKPILTLPPVETKIVSVQFTSAEREFYNSLLEKSQSVFEGFIESGTASKSWFAIFSLLQRLRQACDHVALTVKSQMDPSDWKDKPSSTPPDDPQSTPKSESPNSPTTNKSSFTVGEEFLESLLDKFRRTHSPSKNNTMENPSLDKENVGTYSSQVAHSLSDAIKSEATHVEEECPICLENPKFEDAVITPCAHIFCRDCLVGYLRENAAKQTASRRHDMTSMHCPDGECPVCNEEIKAHRIITMSKSSREDGQSTTTYLIPDSKNPSILRIKKDSPPRPVSSNAGARHTLENALRGAESSKLAAVIEELHKVWELDPGSKVIIFSQFLGFLSLLEVSLRKSKVPFNRLDGKMSLKERVATLDKFNRAAPSVVRAPSTTSDDDYDDDDDAGKRHRVGSVLLVSMKAGGVGLNLVAASSVFILDPWWNAAVEDQCVDRIHRIGQTADLVRVRKFVVQDSVEERIIELQRRKKDMASDILSDARNDGEISNSRPTLDDFKLIFGK